MSSKIKHNKKRNTAFLYEALVRELAKATMKKEKNKRNTVVSIIKEFFSDKKPLARELKLYQDILATKTDDKRLAERILLESRIERSAMDNRALFNEQSALISRINKELTGDVYSNFVPNYKSLATLHQIFNNPRVQAKSRVLLEEIVLQTMVHQDSEEQGSLPHVDDVAYRSFTKTFNKTYGSLYERQKDLIKCYLGYMGSDDLEMKIYLDEELESLKGEIVISEELEIFPEQKQEILALIESYSERQLCDDDLKKILKIQQLVEESKEND
jgi:hypothetical protein